MGDMETLADAMAVKKSWDRPQYAILKEMYLDLKRMHYSFRVNRFCYFLKNLHDLTSLCSGTRLLASSGPCPRWTDPRAPRGWEAPSTTTISGTTRRRHAGEEDANCDFHIVVSPSFP